MAFESMEDGRRAATSRCLHPLTANPLRAAETLPKFSVTISMMLSFCSDSSARSFQVKTFPPSDDDVNFRLQLFWKEGFFEQQ